MRDQSMEAVAVEWVVKVRECCEIGDGKGKKCETPPVLSYIQTEGLI